jgi:hypothetical protein
MQHLRRPACVAGGAEAGRRSGEEISAKHAKPAADPAQVAMDLRDMMRDIREFRDTLSRTQSPMRNDALAGVG